MKSFQNKNIEQPSKSKFAAHMYVFLVNVLANIIFKFFLKQSNKTVIYFKDFLASTSTTLKNIESDLNLNLKNTIKKANKSEEFNVGWLFDGNRLRLQQKIKLKPNKIFRDLKLTEKILLGIHKIFWY